MLKNAFKKHPLQNRTNVQIKGGGGQRPFEQCSKKLHFFERMASLTSITSQFFLGHLCQIYFPASTLLNSLTLILNNLFQLSVHISSLGRHCPFLGIGRAVSKLKVIGEGSHYIKCYSKSLRRASFNYVRQLWQPIQANNIFLQINFLLLFLLQPSTQDARGKEQKEVPMVLLGNKGDMVHLRQVSSEEGDNIILV